VRNKKSRDSAVGIATGYGLDGRGVGVRVDLFSNNSLDFYFGSARFESWPRIHIS
jgi:hypothetical protein